MVCSRCNERERAPNHSWCRPCIRKDNNARYSANRERYSKRTRNNLVKRNYGMTADELKAKRAEAQGCAICGIPDVSHADHKHGTKALRGFLCQKCNMGLGLFRDDPELLRKAGDYLAAFEAEQEGQGISGVEA